MNNFSQKLIAALTAALEDKKALDPQVVELGDDTALADAFIIVSGNSDVHMSTLLRVVDETLTEQGIIPRIEGEHSSQWILIDGGDVIVHVFSVKARQFYSIEKLWEGLKAARQQNV